ncbi:MAG: metallophosphoesterase [Actinobacteria bacterium]|nr:metallophosphoesterase [Actinomycetota bacterium]
MTGKMLVPIVRRGDGTFDARYGEDELRGISQSEMTELKDRIRRFGHYPVVGSADELAALEIEQERDRMFREVVTQSIADWVALAEERLRGSGVRCYMAPGNDDFLEIDSALEGSDIVEFAQDRCISIDEKHDMITTGYSNRTPWDTERELEEPDLRSQLDRMTQSVRDPDNLIAVIHPPPFDTEIDKAPKLDDELKVEMKPGVGVVTAPVGSTAVREFICDVQPLLALHGHVHEGKGEHHLGRTLCVNPGSEYTQGVLSGAIIELGDGEIRRHQFVAG